MITGTSVCGCKDHTNGLSPLLLPRLIDSQGDAMLSYSGPSTGGVGPEKGLEWGKTPTVVGPGWWSKTPSRMRRQIGRHD